MTGYAGFAYRVLPRVTYGLLERPRDVLSEYQYVAYVAIVLERVVKESEPLAFGEAIRATRDWRKP